MSEEALLQSALWAAYGDALGFVTELADKRGVSRRTGGIDTIKALIPWKRRIGGRVGPDVPLPAGCYSDDTELRLATCRAMRGNGYFDVEAFAKIELTVWPSYALGAGRGSKSAAANLTRNDVNWFSNFWDDKGRSYFTSGGNGAAMRIQPHVWACSALDEPAAYLPDVIRNSICTHGHARGIAGAVLHAMCVSFALRNGRVPGPTEWEALTGAIKLVPSLIRQDDDLRTFWVPEWESRSACSLERAFELVFEEVSAHIGICGDATSVAYYPDDERYRRAAEELNALSDSERGSATKTAVLSMLLAWLYRDKGPTEALQVSANLLSSDTDSISTMAGALMGACGCFPFRGDLRDKSYIEAETRRMHLIHTGEDAGSFSYPDIFKWTPPKTHSDAVFTRGNEYWVAGLGRAQAMSDPYGVKGQDAVWLWLKTDFGQTLLAKKRVSPEAYSGDENVVRKTVISVPRTDNLPLFKKMEGVVVQQNAGGIDKLTRDAIASNFDPLLIGRHILELSSGEHGIEYAVAYAAIIAKAKIAREAKP